MAEIFKNKPVGTCLEVGVLDGVKDSITLHFEKQGWQCVLVEANPAFGQAIRANRRAKIFICAAGEHPGNAEFFIAKGAEYLSTMDDSEQTRIRFREAKAEVETVTVPVMRLDDILQEAKVNVLDFATIDVEGAELIVLRGFDLQRWKPRVLVLEDGSGGHDRRARRYLKTKGYECFFYDGTNDWYAAKEDRELLTLRAKLAQIRRGIRLRLGEFLYVLVPLPIRTRAVKWKRRLFGRL